MERSLRALGRSTRGCDHGAKARRKLVERYGGHGVELSLGKASCAHPSTAHGRDLQARTEGAVAPPRKADRVEAGIGRRVIGLSDVAKGRRHRREEAKCLEGMRAHGIVQVRRATRLGRVRCVQIVGTQ